MNEIRIRLQEDEIAEFCRRWKITEMAVLGSALRDDFGPESDVDVLVTFAPGAKWGLFDMVQMQDELAQLLGREVDLVSRRGIEASRNHIRRDAILNSTEVIYAS